ncbi:hypothetical protein KI387_038737, partial [Taxus chinensis]
AAQKGSRMSVNNGTEMEYLYYVCCSNCSTLLAVSVPCKSLFNVVTVKCGHCNDLLCVNMKSSGPQPPLPLTLGQASSSASNSNPILYKDLSPSCENVNDEVMSSNNGTRSEELSTKTYTAPRKRNRPPSAYNRFIKEEIQRIKATNPEMSHKQAFSTAAKN